MLAHYLAVALAKFRKTPFTTAANVLTLALGLACFIAAFGIATFWSSGDGYHPGAERIVYVAPRGNLNGPARIAGDLKEEMPELEAVGRILSGRVSGEGETPVSTGESQTYLRDGFADPGLFQVFAFEFVEGGPETALRASDDVVLTVDAARRLFGEAPALGQTIRVDGQRDATVSAVIEPPRQPSFMNQGEFRFEMLRSVEDLAREFDAATLNGWGFYGAVTVVRLPPSMTIETFQARVDDLVERRVERLPDGSPVMTLRVTPVREITVELIDELFDAPTSALLVGLGALILLVACVNCANLAAAQAAGRLKESGMRKVLGAGRRELLAQHFVEAGLLMLPALGLALAIVAIAAPVFRNLLSIEATYFLTAGPRGALVLGALCLLCAAAVAIYPALTLARVRAGDALGAGQARTGSGVVARTLVGIQFLSASFLLIVVTVTQLQHDHAKTVAFDPKDDPVVVLGDISETGVSFATLEAELSGAPHVSSTTSINWEPWSTAGHTTFAAASPEAGAPRTMIRVKLAGPGYVETLGLEMLAGRGFDPARDRSGTGVFRGPATDLAPLVIDRRLADVLGFSDPATAVGETIYQPIGPNAPPEARPRAVGEVIGVMETDQSRLTGANLGGVIFGFDPEHEQGRYPMLRIDPNNVAAALAEIEQVWAALAPDIPLRARFMDDLFEQSYGRFHTISAVFVIVSVCALVISTIGLLGIAVHVAARRRREMGIRKTLGATTQRLMRLLLVDFSKPILVANLLAWPLANFAAQALLQPFAERVPLTPVPFALSLVITLAIAWAAILGEVLKAASVRPAEVLRHA